MTPGGGDIDLNWAHPEGTFDGMSCLTLSVQNGTPLGFHLHPETAVPVELLTER